MISNCPLSAQIFKRSVLSYTGMYVGVTVILLFYFLFFIVLRGLAVGKTSNYDILQHPTRLHTRLSYNKSSAPVSQRSRVRIPYKPEFFSGFLFATAKVGSITAMIYCFI